MCSEVKLADKNRAVFYDRALPGQTCGSEGEGFLCLSTAVWFAQHVSRECPDRLIFYTVRAAGMETVLTDLAASTASPFDLRLMSMPPLK